MKLIQLAAMCLLAAVGNASTITLTGTGGAIPDNSATGITVDLTTANTGTVTGVQLFFSGLSHTWLGDLVITLEHVGVTGPITVLSRLGVGTPAVSNCSTTDGCGGNFVVGNTYTFATTGTALSSVPNLGTTSTNIPGATYASLNSLAPLNGGSAAGTWRVNISDRASIDTSNSGWTAGVTITTSDVPEPATFAPVLLGLAGIVLRSRRKR